MKKRMLAMLLAAVMVFTVLGGGAFAAAEPEDTAAPETAAEHETIAGPESPVEPEVPDEPETMGEPGAPVEPEIIDEPEETAAEPGTTEEPGDEAAPVLKVEGEDVLLSAYPWDVDIEDPLTDGSPLYDGMGYIMTPAEYAAQFPAAGVEAKGIYLYDWDAAPDTPIYHVYAFEVTDPALTEVTVTVVPNPDPPIWTKVTVHTHGDFYWEMHDCSADWYHGEKAFSEWTFYALEDAGGFSLDLTEASGVRPLMTTGTVEDLGGGMYTLRSQNSVLEFDLGDGIEINYTGETDALLNTPKYVSVSGEEHYIDLYTKIGYTVTPADGNTAVAWGALNEVDGEFSLHYRISADKAASGGADSVTVRIEKITSSTLSFSQPGALLAADPNGGDRGPILTDGDTIPAEGGWLLTKGDVWLYNSTDSYDCRRMETTHSESYSEQYDWWYIYPLKNGVVNVTEAPDVHRAEVTIDNPGGWDLYLTTYAVEQRLVDSATYTGSMIVSDYLFVQSHGLTLRDADYIVPGEGVLDVVEYDNCVMLELDPNAERIFFTVRPRGDIDDPKPPKTGWSYDDASGGWYFYKNDEFVANYWVGKVDGASQWNNNWYYVGADGRMLTGMQYLDDLHGGKGWYFLQPTDTNGEIGKMLTGWQWVGGDYGECWFSTKSGSEGKCTWSEKLGDYDPAAGRWIGG